MIITNPHPCFGENLEPRDASRLTPVAAAEVERFLARRADHRATPLRSLRGLAHDCGVDAVFVKDESGRLGMGSFKALGGSYAVVRLAIEEASRQLGRALDVTEFDGEHVTAVAGKMTFGCATDGNHGRSVATGARLVGARSVVFVHAKVSDERVAAIAACGAEVIRVEGTYDDSVGHAERVCREKGWIVVSDTSWPGYERIPALVMEGYTAMLKEAVDALPSVPTHVFVQAGVGGLAAAVAAYFDSVYIKERPRMIVVEPDRAACLLASAKHGAPVRIDHGKPTIMAMLECYEPSLVAWRILSRKADAFMTVDDDDAREAMRRLARPGPGDPVIVSGESGGAGIAAIMKVARNESARALLGLDETSRVFVINTEGATDRGRYAEIVGRSPEAVASLQDA